MYNISWRVENKDAFSGPEKTFEQILVALHLKTQASTWKFWGKVKGLFTG